MVLGTPRSSKPLALSEKQGGGSIPLAPSTHLTRYSDMKRHYTIGFAGHVDHGKTTLVRCLTGVNTDYTPQEREREISIESGVAPLCLPSGRKVAVMDVPGHIDYLKNTIRGLNQVDLGVLVVAADDGVMVQTREHLEILRFFNAKSGCCVLTKIDLVDKETQELAELELRELVTGTFLADQPICRFSAKEPWPGARIAKALDACLDGLPAETPDPVFRLWIDQVRSLPGHGTVVSGTVAGGQIRCNDDLELLPAGIRARARSLAVHGKPVDHGEMGQRLGINLHRVSLKQVSRGMRLAGPGAIAPTSLLNVDIQILETAQNGIENRQRLKIFLGTSVTSALVILMEEETLRPGESGLAQFRLSKPLPVLAGERFVLSPLNRNTVLGGGRVLDLPREKYRAAKANAIVPLLNALRDKDVAGYAKQVFGGSNGRLITARALAEKTGLPECEFAQWIRAHVQTGELIDFKGRGAIGSDQLESLKSEVKAVMKALFEKAPLKKNVSLAELADDLSKPASDELLHIAAQTLCQEGALIRLDGGYAIPHCQSRFEAHHNELMEALWAYAKRAGHTPFTAHGFWKQAAASHDKTEVSQVLNYLASRKKLVRLNDNRFLSWQGLEEIKARVARSISENGSITVRDSQAVFGFGRMVGTHVLDYLNQIGFTVRRADHHYLTTEGRNGSIAG